MDWREVSVEVWMWFTGDLLALFKALHGFDLQLTMVLLRVRNWVESVLIAIWSLKAQSRCTKSIWSVIEIEQSCESHQTGSKYDLRRHLERQAEGLDIQVTKVTVFRATLVLVLYDVWKW